MLADLSSCPPFEFDSAHMATPAPAHPGLDRAMPPLAGSPPAEDIGTVRGGSHPLPPHD